MPYDFSYAGRNCRLGALARRPESRFAHPLPGAPSENGEREVSAKQSVVKRGELMLKNNAHSSPRTSEQERQDSMALKRRAADDARNDADLFASHIRPQHDQAGRTSCLGLVSEFYCPKPKRAGAGSPNGVGGFLIHVVAGTTSDELLGIYLAAQAEALAAESVRIFRDNQSWSAKYVNWMNQVL